MGAPVSIRDDHDPFWGGLLRYIRWTCYRCPYCQMSFRTDYVPRKVILGNGERTCLNCGKVFDDGSREWPGLNLSEKVRYLLPVPVVGILAAYVVCCSIPFFRRPLNPGELIVVAFMTVVLLVAMVPWLLLRYLAIRKSRDRYAFHQVGRN
jgi:hypothetical protein